jgi:hypothetical protein
MELSALRFGFVTDNTVAKILEGLC